MIETPVLVAIVGAAGLGFTGFLGWLNSRSNNKETRRVSDRDRLNKLEDDVTSLRGQIDTLRGQLRDFDTRWSAVMGTIQQVMWEWFQLWPSSHPRPTVDPRHMEILREHKVDHIIPAGAQPAPPSKENP